MAVGVLVAVGGAVGSYYADTAPGALIVVLAIGVFPLSWPISVLLRRRRTVPVLPDVVEDRAVPHVVTEGHPHAHGPGCGHQPLTHGDHTDFIHEGHRHAPHADHYDLRRTGERAGLTTVYRTLQHMVDATELDALRTADGETAYRRCSNGHHHHLVCRSCGKTIEVSGPAVETWARAVATEYGFRDVSHDLEIFGTCGSC